MSPRQGAPCLCSHATMSINLAFGGIEAGTLVPLPAPARRVPAPRPPTASAHASSGGDAHLRKGDDLDTLARRVGDEPPDGGEVPCLVAGECWNWNGATRTSRMIVVSAGEVRGTVLSTVQRSDRSISRAERAACAAFRNSRASWFKQWEQQFHGFERRFHGLLLGIEGSVHRD